jgi:hypothetical protein
MKSEIVLLLTCRAGRRLTRPRQGDKLRKDKKMTSGGGTFLLRIGWSLTSNLCMLTGTA